MWITTGALPERTVVPAGATRVPVSWGSAKAAVDRASAAKSISAITLLLLFMGLAPCVKCRANLAARHTLIYAKSTPDGGKRLGPSPRRWRGGAEGGFRGAGGPAGD